VVDKDLKECVTEQNAIWFDAACVKEYRLKIKMVTLRLYHIQSPYLWWAIEAVCIQNGLNHD
jgi:hypothetical protein